MAGSSVGAFCGVTKLHGLCEGHPGRSSWQGSLSSMDGSGSGKNTQAEAIASGEGAGRCGHLGEWGGEMGVSLLSSQNVF